MLVSIKTVCETLCRSRVSIYRDTLREDFRKKIKLGGSFRWRILNFNKVFAPGVPMAA